ncbi:Arsenite methyltransferase [Penicillium riverlandense]|uniref:Arsenite methyltransferase n=1 Tax=Penicillium riverlandense TaxID=1903569 RepID=UPI0025479DB3|nr:Arsenite methyltransferase [Penicillium riverlandense]KAJ5807060.1 Arsenite methyltransferase [Penicillium riverlandense]
MSSEHTYRSVQEHYAGVANQTDPINQGTYEQKVATAFGYDLEDLRSIPGNANLGVSCGNPLATANIGLGETVVDLGSGGGIDVLLAAKKVGPEGKAIGIDMTKDMLELARQNARNAGASNVSFIEAYITSIPLPSSTVDCIISNCVVNLVPEAEKPLVFQEIFRLLRPGGRVAISDILATQELPMDIKRDLSFDLNIYKEMSPREESDISGPASSCCDPAKLSTSKKLPTVDFNLWTGSFKIFAIKPDTQS